MAHNLLIFVQNWAHPQAEIFMHLRYEEKASVDIYWRYAHVDIFAGRQCRKIFSFLGNKLSRTTN